MEKAREMLSCWPLKSQEHVVYFQWPGEEPLGAKDLIPTITRKLILPTTTWAWKRTQATDNTLDCILVRSWTEDPAKQGQHSLPMKTGQDYLPIINISYAAVESEYTKLNLPPVSRLKDFHKLVYNSIKKSFQIFIFTLTFIHRDKHDIVSNLRL